jgi:hypothetical protein
MRSTVLMVTALLAGFGGSALAQSRHGGQYPAPPSVAAQSALPECGFAATESWGPNGFQYCDARNVIGSGGRYR